MCRVAHHLGVRGSANGKLQQTLVKWDGNMEEMILRLDAEEAVENRPILAV
jgi:hypothetical protein